MTKERKLVTDYILKNAPDMLRPSDRNLKHPFIDPGGGYKGNLWDWDSYFSALAMIAVAKRRRDPDFTRMVQAHAKGNVLNFLDFQFADGYIPIVLEEGKNSFLLNMYRAGMPLNQHKPFLAASACAAAEFCDDFSWIDLSALEKYIGFYDSKQYSVVTGLYFWTDDFTIGIDNNPTVFGRPNKSCADIYLNTFMYNELIHLSKICEKQNNARSVKYRQKAEDLKQSILEYMYDERDGLFYSVDLNVKTHRTEGAHLGLGAFWNVMPLKIRFWACLLPMMFGLPSRRQAERMVEEHYLDPAISCDFGIRTLASNELMYSNESSSNPSNWLGPVWVVANYCIYVGLRRYGYHDLADRLCDKTVLLLGKDIERSGHMHESYEADTGAPMMYEGFLNWNCLALNMMEYSNNEEEIE